LIGITKMTNKEIVLTGKELQRLRASCGVSQTDVAKYLGYTVKGKPNRSMVARFENEHAQINSRVSMLLDAYFNKLKEEKSNGTAIA